jgi:hypothetical protein
MRAGSTSPAAGLVKLPAWPLFLGGILLLLVWFGLKGWRVFQAAQSLQGWQADAEAMLATGIADVNPDAAEAVVMGMRRDVQILGQEARLFLPLTPHLGWLPAVGPTVEVARQLLEMADAGTEAAAYAFRGLKPGLTLLATGGNTANSKIADLVAVLDAAEGDLAMATSSFDRLQAARNQLGATERLPRRLQTLLEQMDAFMPAAGEGLKLLRVAPTLMGAQGTRRYLILVQNEDELRPTGGFITGVGLLTLDKGDIAALTFEDANLVNDWQDKPYDLPPRPLHYFMGLELFLFRDANFWPDFPTSAETAMALYSYGQDVGPLDGALAVDQRFMEFLLAALGPVTVPGHAGPINSGNVVQRFHEARSFQGEADSGNPSEWFQLRKEFISTFAAAILARVETDSGTVDVVSLVRNLLEAVQSKHLQIYVRDPAAAAALNAAGADGRVPRPGAGDFLMVVDSNMGYNKANLLINRRISYQVDLSVAGAAQAELVVDYSHEGPPLHRPCRLEDGFEPAVVVDYVSLAQLCYWNYLRVYTPAGSQLQEWSRHPVPAESNLIRRGWDGNAVSLDELPGLTTFANYLLLPAAQQLSSRMRYTVPLEALETDEGERRYQLMIIKQAGTRSEPVEVRLILPGGSSLIQANPAPARIEGSQVDFEFMLDGDTLLSVTYR